jgi:hypothetical protein
MVLLVKRCMGDGDKQLSHVVNQSEFGPDTKRNDSKCPYCFKCAASRQRQWKHRNPEKVKAAKREYRQKQKLLARKELNDL